MNAGSCKHLIKGRTQRCNWTKLNWTDMFSFWRSDQWTSSNALH